MTASPTSKATLAAALVGVMFTLPAAKSGCGSKEGVETLTSPVQAVTTLLEHADGTVEAELVLISTTGSPHVFVDTANDVTVRVPGGGLVPLELGSAGHYVASSSDDSTLSYQPGETYQFSFELDDDAAADKVSGGNFVAVMDAPDDEVSFTLSQPPEFAGDIATIEWAPTGRYGLIRVWHEDSDTLTYSSFDFEEPTFDGSKWARLPRGGTEDLSVDTFPEEGTYTISFCAVDLVRDFDTALSAELGALSGFLIGRCAEDQQIVLP